MLTILLNTHYGPGTILCTLNLILLIIPGWMAIPILGRRKLSSERKNKSWMTVQLINCWAGFWTPGVSDLTVSSTTWHCRTNEKQYWDYMRNRVSFVIRAKHLDPILAQQDTVSSVLSNYWQFWFVVQSKIKCARDILLRAQGRLWMLEEWKVDSESLK